jgi:23S rRNA pseudouridine2604 synthase
MEFTEIRINKFLSECGYCSRREADKLLTEGFITINGRLAVLGDKVTSKDEIRVKGQMVLKLQSKLIYLALNKPRGIECTTNLNVKNNIVSFVNHKERIFPIGRLDKDSEGLILMTNDGDIVNKILRAKNNHEQEYIVKVNQPISEKFLNKMRNGVPILDTVTRKCHVEMIDKLSFKIILTQGLNRQIRRMCEFLGYEVVSLKRIRIMNIQLDQPLGRYRELTLNELDLLNNQLEFSEKTATLL